MDPLTPADAQQIVAAYAALLEQHTEQDVYPIATSALPYSKDVIKTSFRTVVAAMTTTGQMTVELRDYLEIAFVSLADYIDDELARLMLEHRQAGVTLAAEPGIGREKMSSDAWQVLTRSSRLAAEIAAKIAAETETLRSEFRALAPQTC
jgi:GDP-D-mannose dehydratase